MNDKYKIEELNESPVIADCIRGANFSWGLVRKHDDELISVYDTKEEAELALLEANASLERAERSDDTLQDFVRCENCGGSGVISYNPNLNPNSFPGTATAKCTRCGGTGIEDTANASLERLAKGDQ